MLVAFVALTTLALAQTPAPSAEADLVLHGSFIVIGKQPDGDSVRFRPGTPELLKQLKRADRIRPSSDGTVQLRFEAIDAPELHFENLAQPLGRESRDALLELMGFTNLRYTPNGLQVRSSTPLEVRGAILSRGAEVYGRPISYVFLERDHENTVQDGVRIGPSDGLLRRSLNARMLENGMAYLTVYSSQPEAHRALMRSFALGAKSAMRGVWSVDKTSRFELESLEDVTQRQLILPKLFRRAVAYLQDRRKGFVGSFADWFTTHPDSDLVLSQRTIPTCVGKTLERFCTAKRD
jgi:endonuclease YncB( thermonuclease family)